MSTAAGDPWPHNCYPYGPGGWPHPHYVPYGAPGMPMQGAGTTTYIPTPITEDRIREIIREELTRALESLK